MRLADRIAKLYELARASSHTEDLTAAWAKWRTGDRTWKLHEGQREADRLIEARKASREVLEMARKFGKTWYLVFRADRICNGGPKRRYVYGASTYKHLVEFVEPVVDEFFSDAPPEMKPKWVSAKGHLEFPNGSWVHFFGADDKPAADRGRGPKAEEAAFDEAGFCPVLSYVVRVVFRPSLLLSGGKTVLSSTPAEEVDHEFTKMAEIAEANGTFSRKTIYDNPMLTREQIEKFIADDAKDSGMTVEEYVSTDDFKREYLAMRVVNKMLIVMGDDWEMSQEKCVRESERPEFFDAYGALDMGGGDPHAHTWGYLDFKRNVFVFEHELLLTDGENTETLAGRIKAKETEIYGTTGFNGKLRASGSVGANADASWLIHRLGQVSAEPQPYLRVADNDLLVIKDMAQLHGLAYLPTKKDDLQLQVNNLRIMLRQGRIEIHPRCKHTIRHWRSTLWENNKRMRFKHNGKEHGDLLACGIYQGRNIDWSLNPYPKTWHAPGSPPWLEQMAARAQAEVEAQLTRDMEALDRLNAERSAMEDDSQFLY